MASKNEWAEYFELINDRKPTAEEIVAAVDAGEITVEQKTENQSVNTTNTDKNEAVSETAENAKKQFKSYFNWLKSAWSHPEETEKSGEKYYGVVTLVIAALALGITIWQICVQKIEALAGSTTSFFSFGYSTGASYAANEVNKVTQQIFIPSLLFVLALYFAVIISGFVAKKAIYRHNELSFWNAMDYYGRMFGIVLGINLLAVICAIVSLTDFASFLLVISVCLVGFIGTYSVLSSANNGKLDNFYAGLLGNVVYIIVFGLIAYITYQTLGQQVISTLSTGTTY